MKKYIIMAVTALASIVFVSCDPKETVDPNAKVVIKPKTLEIAVGEQGKLRAALSPAKDGIAITYSSDNKEIATVDASGLVSGVSAGTVNIIATAKDYKADTCVVTVIEKADAFAWAGMYIGKGSSAKILNNKDTLYDWIVEKGDTIHIKCLLCATSGFAWDQDIFLDNSTKTGLAGKGYFASIESSAWLILDSIDEKGPRFWIFSGGVVFLDTDFDPTDTAYAYCAKAGTLGDPKKQYDYYVEGEGDEPGTIGSDIWYMDASTFNGNPTVGLIGRGVIQGDIDEAYYKINVGWFPEESGVGLAMISPEEFKEPLEWATPEYYYYEKLPSKSIAKPQRSHSRQAHNAKIEQSIKKFQAKKNLEQYHVLQ